jgi:cadmium resistance protein CadD (predicted permease)
MLVTFFSIIVAGILESFLGLLLISLGLWMAVTIQRTTADAEWKTRIQLMENQDLLQQQLSALRERFGRLK